MAKLGSIAAIQVAGMPAAGDDDTLTDAWYIWTRIRNSVTDRNRGKDEQDLPCKPMTLDGIQGWAWQGHISDARKFVFPPGQPREHPYTPGSSDPEDIQRAKNNFSTVHSRLTKSTANMVNIETHRVDPSVWWVRDEFSGITMPEGTYGRLLALARGEEVTEPPPPVQPEPPEPAPGYVYICRYRDATGCAYTTPVQGSMYSHSESSTIHSRHEVPLLICPVCGDGFDSPLGRGLHLSKTEDAAKDSPRRNQLDLDQTTQLWRKREERRALLASMPDPDIEAAINAFTPRKPEPEHPDPAIDAALKETARIAMASVPDTPDVTKAAPPAEPDPAAQLPPETGTPSPNAAVDAVRQLVSDYDKAIADRDHALAELVQFRKQQAQIDNIKAALQLAQEALNDQA